MRGKGGRRGQGLLCKVEVKAAREDLHEEAKGERVVTLEGNKEMRQGSTLYARPCSGSLDPVQAC
eukprot:52362-Chlamydomonas_euryale.AAC.1